MLSAESLPDSLGGLAYGSWDDFDMMFGDAPSGTLDSAPDYQHMQDPQPSQRASLTTSFQSTRGPMLLPSVQWQPRRCRACACCVSATPLNRSYAIKTSLMNAAGNLGVLVCCAARRRGKGSAGKPGKRLKREELEVRAATKSSHALLTQTLFLVWKSLAGRPGSSMWGPQLCRRTSGWGGPIGICSVTLEHHLNTTLILKRLLTRCCLPPQAHFGLGLREAADRLGICATTLKRACRRVGIQRWPRRLVPSASADSGGQQGAGGRIPDTLFCFCSFPASAEGAKYDFAS